MKKIFLCFFFQTLLLADTSSYYIKNYENRVALFPNFLTYEKIANASLYYSFEGFYNIIGSRCAQIETRIGYNMNFKNNDYFCPYVAGGWLKSFHSTCAKNNTLDQLSLFFGGLGLCYDHEILSIFHIGFRSEILLGSSVKAKKDHLTYGFEGRVPLTFYFGHKGKYDFRLEPFAIFLSNNNTSCDLWGLILSLGYKF